MERERTMRAMAPRACEICGDERLVVVQSRWARRGLDRFNPRWRPAPVTYELCRRCGAKYRIEHP